MTHDTNHHKSMKTSNKSIMYTAQSNCEISGSITQMRAACNFTNSQFVGMFTIHNQPCCYLLFLLGGLTSPACQASRLHSPV